MVVIALIKIIIYFILMYLLLKINNKQFTKKYEFLIIFLKAAFALVLNNYLFY